MIGQIELELQQSKTVNFSHWQYFLIKMYKHVKIFLNILVRFLQYMKCFINIYFIYRKN